MTFYFRPALVTWEMTITLNLILKMPTAVRIRLVICLTPIVVIHLCKNSMYDLKFNNGLQKYKEMLDIIAYTEKLRKGKHEYT